MRSRDNFDQELDAWMEEITGRRSKPASASAAALGTGEKPGATATQKPKTSYVMACQNAAQEPPSAPLSHAMTTHAERVKGDMFQVNQSLQMQLKAAKQQLQQKEEASRQLEEQLASSAKEIKLLRSQKPQSFSRSVTPTANQTMRSQSRETNKLRVRDLEDRVEQLEAENKLLKKGRHEIQASTMYTAAQYAALQKQLAQLEEQLNLTTQALNGKDQQLRRQALQIQRLQAELRQKDAQLIGSKSAMRSVTNSNVSLSSMAPAVQTQRAASRAGSVNKSVSAAAQPLNLYDLTQTKHTARSGLTDISAQSAMIVSLGPEEQSGPAPVELLSVDLQELEEVQRRQREIRQQIIRQQRELERLNAAE